MSRTPRAASTWGLLQRDLGGSFIARAHGLLGAKFALMDSRDRRFGWLRLHGLSVAEFQAGDCAATLKKTGENYRMVANGEEVLAAGASKGSMDELGISCGGHTYEARASFFRNLAVASYPGGERVVRLSGGLTGRSYEALFAAEDGCALPVAVFLLWHVAANRRRAYRMGPRREEEYRGP
jgi:hypothetical protein